ncbi:hypothetical protein EJ02DRAFT_14309 [Clathrospora elynae]|uniref:Uncharacterized protein n=1 Tax=Clathrospora elynae TaxID=706981 RepID=A0A6A5T1R5_9PLEO|nr:hypothetical protein EJ02DRAFT_14309 [Clathrospora elynae]
MAKMRSQRHLPLLLLFSVPFNWCASGNSPRRLPSRERTASAPCYNPSPVFQRVVKSLRVFPRYARDAACGLGGGIAPIPYYCSSTLDVQALRPTTCHHAKTDCRCIRG